MNGFIYRGSRGRFGNHIFRFLASKLFCILYNCELSEYLPPYRVDITDDIFCEWMKHIFDNKLIQFPINNFEFSGYYQHDLIYRKFKQEIINHINDNKDQHMSFNNTEVNFINGAILDIPHSKIDIKLGDLIGIPPVLPFNYTTAIHLRIEDFLQIGLAMNPKSIDIILTKCEPPFLFIHKPICNDLDEKYIYIFKKKYPDAFFFDGSLLECYNILRTSKTLICSQSTLSWIAALFNDTHDKIYMPKQKDNIIHQSFQYPSDKTELYEYEYISPDNIKNI